MAGLDMGGEQKAHILLACMPKSGSTYFSAAFSQYSGFRAVFLVVGFGRREQEPDLSRLIEHKKDNYVAQLHLRHSTMTQMIIQAFGLTPVVLTRNLADIAVSLRDYIRKEAETPLAYFTERHRQMDDAGLEEAVVHLAMPWYLNFYAGWKNDGCNPLFIDYEDMTRDTAGAMMRVYERAGFAADPAEVAAALQRAANIGETRFNVGTSGRGKNMSPPAAAALLKLLAFYPEFHDDPLFVKTRKTLEGKN
ncbi:MAG: sulfotransferase domain-containing protein [Alphaproteobacteria bacterium]|nr:sulfotransferase domain-containing protein [Alphaproteobacteria bacterium]MDE2337214.1 sulfotransferase domain-containing protein [Alphaproteobacteria bacterium]